MEGTNITPAPVPHGINRSVNNSNLLLTPPARPSEIPYSKEPIIMRGNGQVSLASLAKGYEIGSLE